MKASKQNTRPLILVSTAHAVNHALQVLLPSVSLKVTAEFGIDSFTFGLLVAVFSLSYSLFQAPFGAYAERLGRKRLLSSGLILSSAALALAAIAWDVPSLAFLLFIAGIGGATYHPLGIYFISNHYPEKKGTMMGYHQTGGAIGTTLAPLLIGTISVFSWRLAFVALSAFGLAISYLTWRFLPDIKDKPMKSERPIVRDLTEPFLLIFASTLYLVVLRGIQAFGALYFKEGRHTGDYMALVLYALLQVAGIFSGPVSGRLSDVFSRRRVIFILVLLEILSSVAMIFSGGIPLYLACLLFGFASFGLLATTDAFLTDITNASLLSAVIGISMTATFFVSVIVSPILGFLIDIYGYNTSILLITGFSSLGLMPLTLIHSHPKKRQTRLLDYSST